MSIDALQSNHLAKLINMRNPSRSAVLNDITMVTSMLHKAFPELYQYLSETPIREEADISELGVEELAEYLESIRIQWRTYSKVHQMRRYMGDHSYLKHYIQLIEQPAAMEEQMWI